MRISYTYEVLHSTKKDQDFYVVRIALVDKDNTILRKSQPLLWITKEQFEKLSSLK